MTAVSKQYQQVHAYIQLFIRLQVDEANLQSGPPYVAIELMNDVAIWA